MVNQTIPPEDFVLYCDGLLTNELYEEIDSLRKKYSILNVIYNETPMGLGNALNNGLKYCKTTLLQEWTVMILQYLKEWSFSLKRL